MKPVSQIGLLLLVAISFMVVSFVVNIDEMKLQRSSNKYLSQALLNLVSVNMKSQAVKQGQQIDENWLAKIQEDIKKQEYEIRWQSSVNAYQSPNRANNLRFTYYTDGFSVKPRTTRIPKSGRDLKNKRPDEIECMTIEDWEIRLKLLGLKNGKEIIPFAGKEFNTDKNYASIEDNNLKIEYTNDEEGMRQNFIVKEKPANGKEKIEIAMKVESKLKTFVGRNAVAFRNEKSQDKMYYKGLKVWDSDGKELVAYFSKLEKDEFSIVVNTENAIYPITIDPLSTTENWTAESNQAGAQFGYSVSTAGDVNGDGYSDVIVGANWYDGGLTDQGAAFVYHGSSTGLSTTANWTEISDNSYTNFGISVSTAGDVNGDGYSDVIVGSFYSGGSAYVYHGSSSGLSTTANWTYASGQSLSYFGIAVSTAGDVNGDGYSDVIVGAHQYDSGQTDEGKAFVYYGSSSGLSTSPNWTAESNQAGAAFGRPVSTAGDVNGDGYSDVIVGAYLYDNGQTDEGRAYVYLGSASGLDTAANWIVESNQASAYFGLSVSTAGDVNGDGYGDVIVGAPSYNNVQTDEGVAFVYYGSASGLSTTANRTLECNQDNAHFGRSVSTAGDINGDGFSDVIVGIEWYDNGQTDEGGAFVYLGSASGLDTTANWTAESNQASAYFGLSVSTAGDVNGDGYSDVIVGAYAYDNVQTDEGRAFVYHGSASGLSTTANWTAESNQGDAYFGASVSTAGDVNGDGYSDVIVGAYLYDNVQTDEGRAFVYHGSSSGLSTTANWTAESDQSFAFFGNSVSTAGDVNGDGFSDVIVGAYEYDNEQTDEGRAFVYHGSSSGLSITANWTAESNRASAWFGNSVSTAGDVNGDGYSDVIVGAYKYDNGETDEGGAFVYHGSPSGLSTTANWTAESNQASAYFGNSVSTAGDVNGDGFSDVIVGAYGYDNPELDEGRVFVYHGSSSGLSTSANWTAEGNQYFAGFGNSVSTAGDVNGDGFSDVIVGAYGYDNIENNEGRAFVYHGSSSGLSTSVNWTAESDQAGAYLGISVSTTGDVNGDGFSDVIVGAYWYDNGETNEGRAFVYYGNGRTGLRKTVQQYKPSSSTIVGPHGKTDAVGQVRLNTFGKSPFGRADGKLVWEYKRTGQPFGSIVSSSGEGSFTDLGTTITGVELNNDVSGITTGYSYRWRVRVKYNPVNNPYQIYGPWRYYEVYQPFSFGSFKAQDQSLPVQSVLLSAISGDSKITLIWETKNEIENAGFEILRKTQDEVEFKMIASYKTDETLKGLGTDPHGRKYTYVDKGVRNGILYEYKIYAVSFDGQRQEVGGIVVRAGEIPKAFVVYQNYPNPFNPGTEIKFDLPEAGNVKVEVYNLLGEKVATLYDGFMEAGFGKVIRWDAVGFSSGVYFCRVSLNNRYVSVKKMLLVR